MSKQILNIDNLDYMDWGHGTEFSARFGALSRKMGARGLGYNLTVVPAGKRAFPFHSHRVNEEMFFVVSGTGKVRLGAETFPIRAGDVIACPPGGPECARQIINDSNDELQYLAVSSTMSPEIAEYPDSDKTAVIMKLEDDGRGMPNVWRLMMKNESTQVDYWEDEDGA